MSLLSKLFSENRSIEVVGTETVDGYDDTVLVNYQTYQWYSSKHRNQALQYFNNIIRARDLGLRNQSMLNAREVVRTAFRDYCKGNGLEANEMTLHQLTDNHDTGLFRIDDFLDLWYMHPLDTKSVRLPTEALNAVDVLQDFPQGFIQDMKILEAVKRKPVKSKDYRFTDERPYFAPAIIVMSDPILAVKTADQWYSVLRWG